MKTTLNLPSEMWGNHTWWLKVCNKNISVTFTLNWHSTGGCNIRWTIQISTYFSNHAQLRTCLTVNVVHGYHVLSVTVKWNLRHSNQALLHPLDILSRLFQTHGETQNARFSAIALDLEGCALVYCERRACDFNSTIILPSIKFTFSGDSKGASITIEPSLHSIPGRICTSKLSRATIV
jgi:hypothetical protein